MSDGVSPPVLAVLGVQKLFKVFRGASHLGPVWNRRSPPPTTASGDWSNGAWNTNEEANRDGAMLRVQPDHRANEAIRQRMRMAGE